MHKGKIKSTYKEGHRLVLILVSPVVIRQSERLSDLPDLLSIPEFLAKDSKLSPANGMLPATETPLSEHREKGCNGRPLVLIETHKKLRNYLVRIPMSDYEVVSACDAETVFTTIYEQCPDAVLTSSAPVGVSGEELAARIESDDRVAHVPVTLPVKPGEDSEETQRNANLYMTMPFAISFLKAGTEGLITNREIIRKRYIRLTLEVDAPDDVKVDVPLSDDDQEFISLVRSLTEERFTDSRFTIDKLSDCVDMSRSSLYNRIKEITGYAPADCVRSIRLNKALISLMSGKYIIAEVVNMTGFNDLEYFRIVFKKRFGDLPTKYISNL